MSSWPPATGGGGGGGAPSVESRYGWQDFADTGAVIPEITSLQGGEVKLTCDANGTLTDGNTNVNAASTLPGVNDIWDSSTNTIEFGGTGLQVNDVIDVRLDFGILPAVVPCEAAIRLRFYDAPGGSGGTGSLIFTLDFQVSSVQSGAGVESKRIVAADFFVGQSIASGSAEIVLETTAACTAPVRGWFMKISRKG